MYFYRERILKYIFRGCIRQISPLMWNYRQRNTQQPPATQSPNVKWLTLQRVKSLMKYIARRKMRCLAQEWTSLENAHQTALSVSTAISQSSSHPSPSLKQGDFSGSHDDLRPMTSLSVSSRILICGSSVIQTQIQKRMKFSRELLLDAHQGTVLLDVSALVGKERERERGWESRGALSNHCTTSLAKDSLAGPECFPFTPDKANTEPGAFVCLLWGTSVWCHITKCVRANRNITIKNKVCF